MFIDLNWNQEDGCWIAKNWYDMDRRWFPVAIVENGSDSLTIAGIDNDEYGREPRYYMQEADTWKFNKVYC